MGPATDLGETGWIISPGRHKALTDTKKTQKKPPPIVRNRWRIFLRELYLLTVSAELTVIEHGILTVELHKGIVIADLFDVAVFHVKDHVSVTDG